MLIREISKFKFDSYQKAAVRLCKELQSRGFSAYWVGGAVRDMALGRAHFDIDIATSAKPEDVKKACAKAGFRTYALGERFGAIGAAAAGRIFEITSMRAESGYEDFRHPSQVRFGVDLKTDAARRDFTVNAIYFDPVSMQLLDPCGGLKDLKLQRLRFVGTASKRIKEDPLRLLRAVRFAAELNFKISAKDFTQIKRCAPLILKISGERVRQELDKIMAGKNFLRALRLLDQSGLLAQILPEVEILKAVKQSKNYHAEGNVFKHTFLVLEQLQDADRILRYAGLFHDIGKYATGVKTVKAGRPHISFHGHAQKSAELFGKIAKRLRFSREEASKIAYLLAHHMDLRPIETIRESTLIEWSKNPWFIDLIRLRIADSLGAWQTNLSGRVVKKEMQDWEKIIPKVKRWQKIQPPKILSGVDVMRVLKLRPGRRVGEILQQLEILQKQGKIKNRKQGITFLKSLDKGKA